MKKIFINIILVLSLTAVSAQNNKKYNLKVTLPSDFIYDSLYMTISNESGKTKMVLPARQSKKLFFKKIIPSSVYSQTSIRIFFGSSNYNFIDTLYLDAKNDNSSIRFLKTDIEGNTKKPIQYQAENLYNFDTLYVKFLPILYREPEEIADSDSASKSLDIDNKVAILNFITANIFNPNSLDLFIPFVLINRNFNYEIANDFYERTFKFQPIPPVLREKIDSMLNAKIFLSQVNIQAPDFSFTTTKNHFFSKSNLKGKYVLLNYWATWCVPCLEELPHLKNIINKYDGDSLEIFSISLDADNTGFDTFLAKHEMTWKQVVMNKKVIDAFGVNPIPQVFLINPDGIIIYNKLLQVGEDKDLKILDNLLDSLQKKIGD